MTNVQLWKLLFSYRLRQFNGRLFSAWNGSIGRLIPAAIVHRKKRGRAGRRMEKKIGGRVRGIKLMRCRGKAPRRSPWRVPTTGGFPGGTSPRRLQTPCRPGPASRAGTTCRPGSGRGACTCRSALLVRRRGGRERARNSAAAVAPAWNLAISCPNSSRSAAVSVGSWKIVSMAGLRAVTPAAFLRCRGCPGSRWHT